MSPFGAFEAPVAVVDNPLAALRSSVEAAFGTTDQKKPKQLKSVDDAVFLPRLIEKIADAPANDAPDLDNLSQFLLLFRETWREKNLDAVFYDAMRAVFDKKTELFLIDHQTKEHCEKMGWNDPYRDLVLFSKERDALVGRFFAPATEQSPGQFSEFVNAWAASENPDRLLHLLDFCAGSKRPTFEHYLLFSHPALNRVVSNKSLLRELLEKAQPVIVKLTSPTWENDVRTALGV